MVFDKINRINLYRQHEHLDVDTLMDHSKVNNEMIELILKGNDMIKRHAEERQVLLKQIVDAANNGKVRKDPKQVLDELDASGDDFNTSEYYKVTKLAYINAMIAELDFKKEQKAQLVDSIMQIDANLLSREELMGILSEYVEMEEAMIMKFVGNYSEAQEILQDNQEEIKVYDVLSSNDPRYKALKVLDDHPQGISITQLSFMLGTTHFHAQKIIRELTLMELIERSGNLIKSAQHVDFTDYRSQLIEITANTTS